MTKKTAITNRTEDYLISVGDKEFSSLTYQMVYCVENDVKYVKSFNILYKAKIIRKVYMDRMIPIAQITDPEEFIVQYILPAQHDKEQERSTSWTNKENTKTRPDKKARQKAASDLFSDLGL